VWPFYWVLKAKKNQRYESQCNIMHIYRHNSNWFVHESRQTIWPRHGKLGNGHTRLSPILDWQLATRNMQTRQVQGCFSIRFGLFLFSRNSLCQFMTSLDRPDSAYMSTQQLSMPMARGKPTSGEIPGKWKTRNRFYKKRIFDYLCTCVLVYRNAGND